MKNSSKKRIETIDLLRGAVMILMALDHARIYFGYGSFFTKPTDLHTTTPFLFFTRWITHFCAPVFVFLAGTSAFLYGARRNNIKNVSWFLFTRGIWLILVELVIVRFGWTFDITFSTIILQVIWVIGVSMVFLSVVVYLPRWLIFIIGIILVFGHNLFDSISVGYFDSIASGQMTAVDFILYVLHQPNFIVLAPNFVVIVVYPLIPWLGLMALGYVFGILYQKDFAVEKRRKVLLWIGCGAIILFLFLRGLNIYGDPMPWEQQRSFIFSVISFFNVTKYPISLSFILMTIGPSLIFLSLAENVKNRFMSSIIVFGRVPFFFYVIHIYLFHLLGVLGIIYDGRSWTDAILTANSFITTSLADSGFSLYIVYIVWILVTLSLYPLCKRYNSYKTVNKAKWWLSYL